MKEISIEYAHIYTNDKIGEEHELSLKLLTELEKGNKEDYSLVVMVDDYSFPDPTFDYGELIAWLSEKGFKPDVTFRESQLIPVCDEVIRLIQDEKIKEELSEYIRAKKYPCSLFIASWYLLRLGYVSSPIFDKALTANKLINILPQSFKPFEDKALGIIEATDFASAKDQIENRYFEGRKI